MAFAKRVFSVRLPSLALGATAMFEFSHVGGQSYFTGGS
jgi:hypothetical protein